MASKGLFGEERGKKKGGGRIYGIVLYASSLKGEKGGFGNLTSSREKEKGGGGKRKRIFADMYEEQERGDQSVQLFFSLGGKRERDARPRLFFHPRSGTRKEGASSAWSERWGRGREKGERGRGRFAGLIVAAFAL